MSKLEAATVIAEQILKYKVLGYDELCRRLNEIEDYEVVAPSGTTYQIGVQIFLDGGAAGDIRVMGGIDGGGISASLPLSDDFIIRPDGTFIGE